MIFKQKVLKEEKIKLSIIFSCLVILVLLVVIFAVICDGTFELIFTFAIKSYFKFTPILVL